MRQRSFTSGFPADLPLQDAIGLLQEELDELGAVNTTLSCDIEHPLSSRLRKKHSEDSGVCLTFQHDGVRYHLPADRWALIAHNIYALHLFLRSVRNIERWGILTIAQQLQPFRTSAARPEIVSTGNEKEAWREELGIGPGASLEDAHALYRSRAKRYANDEDMLMRLNLAMDEARRHLG